MKYLRLGVAIQMEPKLKETIFIAVGANRV
jgi:hypothetical protein